MGFLDLLEKAGNLFDLPGSMVRDVATWNNPFDQLLSPLGSENRMSGRDVLEKWGALGANQDGLDFGDVAGGALGMAMDPFSWVSGTGALKFLGRGGKAADTATTASTAGRSLVPYRQPLDELVGLTGGKVNPLLAGNADVTSVLRDALGETTTPLLTGPAPPFYSRLRNAIEGLPDRPIKSQSLLNTLKKHPEGISMDEWDWSDMPDLVADNPMLSKDKLLKHLDEWGISTKRIDHGDGSISPPMYGDYSIPGGDNYRESLIQERVPASLAQYISPHWPATDNIAAHLRTSTRNFEGAGPVHFIDELQSDWHQAGRNVGYGSEKLNPNTAIDFIAKKEGRSPAQVIEDYGYTDPEDYIELAVSGGGWQPQVPHSPFAGSWQDLALKQALYDAASKGSPGIGWTTGRDIHALVGGELSGQAKFYDNEIYNRLRKLLGAKGQKDVDFQVRDMPGSGYQDEPGWTAELIEYPGDFPGGHAPQTHGEVGNYIPIDPKVRARILAEGFPLLSVPLLAALGYGLTEGDRSAL